MAKEGKCSKKGRKGRSPSQQRYKLEQRWKKNKVTKLKRYVAKNPQDIQAAKSLEKLLRGEKGVKGKRRHLGAKDLNVKPHGLLKPYHDTLNPNPKGVQWQDTFMKQGKMYFTYRKQAA